ncbi:MAG: serine/threonine protein kinase [Polyangiaceae bacterium]|nr:serine/threonine protein kinase [Polyangiaceae bacterium]
MDAGRGWQGERGAFPTASPPTPSSPPPSAGPSSLRPEAPPEPPDASALLRDSETVRTAVFYRAMLVVALLVLVALPILPGPAWLRVQTAVACFLAAALCLGLSVISRDRRRYTSKVATAGALALPALAVVVMYYLGLYSASTSLLSVGIYFYGSSESRRIARTAYVCTAVLYFIGTLAIALDLIPDLAVFSSEHVGRPSRLYRVVMQQAIFGMTFYLARSVRRATQAAVEKAQQGEQLLRQREAQLLEAKGELDRALRPGEGRLTGEVLDRYRLGHLLGRGGMGEVYAAEIVESSPTSQLRPVVPREGAPGHVAVKLLHPNMLADPSNVQRFLREARAAAAVPCEHVAQVLSVGNAPNGVPFIVMELLEGHDLAFYLRRAAQLPLRQVVELVEHTSRALAAVRDAGIVHRDLKPGNIFLTDTLPRRWKVLDFGLSKLQGAEAITKDQAVGTPSYMAPEQVEGDEVDHLADLYALTAIAYRAVTGRPPFVGDEVAKVLMDVLTRVPESPRAFAAVPVDVELVLAIGLAKKRRDRFESVEALAAALILAERGELDDATRKRGWALLKQAPWGSSVRLKRA